MSRRAGAPLAPRRRRGRPVSLRLRLTPQERRTLEAWQRSHTLPQGLVRRGRIVLLRAEGRGIEAIAALVGISRRYVYKWVQRFLAQGVGGLRDLPRGRPASRGKEGG